MSKEGECKVCCGEGVEPWVGLVRVGGGVWVEWGESVGLLGTCDQPDEIDRLERAAGFGSTEGASASTMSARIGSRFANDRPATGQARQNGSKIPS